MDGLPPVISVFLGDLRHINVLVDTGCQCFGAVTEEVAEEFAESILEIPPRSLRQAAGVAAGVSIHQIATF